MPDGRRLSEILIPLAVGAASAASPRVGSALSHGLGAALMMRERQRQEAEDLARQQQQQRSLEDFMSAAGQAFGGDESRMAIVRSLVGLGHVPQAVSLVTQQLTPQKEPEKNTLTNEEFQRIIEGLPEGSTFTGKLIDGGSVTYTKPGQKQTGMTYSVERAGKRLLLLGYNKNTGEYTKPRLIYEEPESADTEKRKGPEKEAEPEVKMSNIDPINNSVVLRGPDGRLVATTFEDAKRVSDMMKRGVPVGAHGEIQVSPLQSAEQELRGRLPEAAAGTSPVSRETPQTELKQAGGEPANKYPPGTVFENAAGKRLLWTGREFLEIPSGK
jgi:hypothetical protein